jgi:DNA-binding CsgD family transcriptional regulator
VDAVARSDQLAVEVSVHPGHHDEAAAPGRQPTRQTRWAVTAATIRYWRTGDVTAAERVLAAAGGPVAAAHRAGLTLLDGRTVAAEGDQVFRDRAAPGAATVPGVAAGRSLLRGLVASARGDLVAAVTALDTAARLLAEHDPHRMLAPCLAELAATHAMSGDQAEARRALRRATEAPADRLSAPLLGLSQAWTTAAGGDTTLAARQANTAADAAMAAGQCAAEARARYDVARLGDPQSAHRRLATLAESTQSPLTPTMAAAAAALAHSDVPGLDRATAAFAALGFDLLAAETATVSAAIRNQPATAHLTAVTPLLRLTPALTKLTRRERDVALLVADGMTSSAIGDRLRLSARTVDNCLGRIYQKLDVTSRRDVVPLVLRES